MRMNVKLNEEGMLKLFQDFYALTGLRLGFINKDSLTESLSFPLYASKFCDTMRTNPVFKSKCHDCDARACEISRKSHTLYIYKCHVGLCEAVSPVISNGILLGWMMMGQLILAEEETRTKQEIVERCAEYGFSQNTVQNLLATQQVVSKSKVESAFRLLDIYAKYIHFADYVKVAHSSLTEQIGQYIEDNIQHSDLSLQSICSHFEISKSYANQVFNREAGISIGRYIARKRTEAAKKMLGSGNLNISQVAYRLGFSDAYYFARFFKKNTGFSPSKYQEQKRKDT